MQYGRQKIAEVWKAEDELIRPILRAGRDRSVGMGSVSRRLYSKLNRDGGLRQKSGSSKSTNRPSVRRGNVFDYSVKGYAQRVIIKAHYVRHVGRASNAKTLRSHAYYLMRDGAGVDGEKPDFYSSEDDVVNSNDFVNSAKNDPRHFRIIISPENGSEIEDMRSYVRDVMDQVQQDLGKDLDWVAVNHFNTDNPHAHVLIRGLDKKGREVEIGKDYISHGMRTTAQKVATSYLGERSLSDIQKSQKKEVSAQRVTSLDYKIEVLAGKDRLIDVRIGNRVGKSLFEDSLIRGRLKYLRSMGLVKEKEIGVFEVKEDFKETLFEASKRGDVIKQMYSRIGKETAQMVYLDLRKSEGQEVSGVVIDKGPVDELRDRYYVIIKDQLGRANYINIGSNRKFDDIRNGSIIKVDVKQASTGKADYNIGELAKDNNGVYNLYKHYAHVDENMKFLSDDERQSYVERHLIRLETLEKEKVVERINDVEFKVPEDVVEKGKKITEKINESFRRYGVADVKFVSEKPLEKQVDAEAWTYLDKKIVELSKEGRALSTGWKEVDVVLEKRAAYLKANGYAQAVNGQIHIDPAVKSQLQQKELKSASVKVENKFNRQYQSLAGVQELTGVYRGTVKLHSGHYAVITSPSKVALVPYRGSVGAKVGQELKIHRNAKGVFKFRQREMGLSL